eukprot:6476333-Amphidinium_carterae.2
MFQLSTPAVMPPPLAQGIASHLASYGDASSRRALRELAHCAHLYLEWTAIVASHAHDRSVLPQPQPCCEAELSDPDDYLPLTELANNPGTPPHLLVDPGYELAPTQLDALPDTLRMDRFTAAVDALRLEEGSVPPPGDAPLDTCPESVPVSQAAAVAGLGSLSSWVVPAVASRTELLLPHTIAQRAGPL